MSSKIGCEVPGSLENLSSSCCRSDYVDSHGLKEGIDGENAARPCPE